MSKIRDWILELLYPTRAVCLGCGAATGCDQPFLCEACRSLLQRSDVMISRDEWKKHGLESIAFVYYYGRPIKGMIRAFKFHGVHMLANSMAQEMARLIDKREIRRCDMIVPVPLHPSRLSERGYNQAEMLAKPLAAMCNTELRTDVLQRIRRTRQQSKLKRSERMNNTRAAFRATKCLNGKRILLVDDVVTTGSTLCACAEALAAAGAKEIRAVVLAGSHSCRFGKAHRYRLKKVR